MGRPCTIRSRLLKKQTSVRTCDCERIPTYLISGFQGYHAYYTSTIVVSCILYRPFLGVRQCVGRARVLRTFTRTRQWPAARRLRARGELEGHAAARPSAHTHKKLMLLKKSSKCFIAKLVFSSSPVRSGLVVLTARRQRSCRYARASMPLVLALFCGLWSPGWPGSAPPPPAACASDAPIFRATASGHAASASCSDAAWGPARGGSTGRRGRSGRSSRDRVAGPHFVPDYYVHVYSPTGESTRDGRREYG